MERTKKQYKHLSAEERATIMLMQGEKSGVREIGRYLNRSASTISRELSRDLGTEACYTATLAGEQANILRLKHRKESKLEVGGILFNIVKEHLNPSSAIDRT